uniref:Uncharacterized protein n=1 Tax=Paulinella longichromatophora TaxID=1708747 RepID=A0A2H4ZQR9_9EUKA|nr:hypothetical protein PLO_893 [Paulinella longichromatophora]
MLSNYANPMHVKRFRKQDLTFKIPKLVIKTCLNTVLTIKLLQLVNISGHRFEQQNSIRSLLKSQLITLNQTTGRVDYLFGTEGNLCIFYEHREWIERNHLRIVWTTT